MLRAVLALTLVAACGGKAPPPEYYTPQVCPDPRGKEIVLGVGDLIQINVWDQKDLNTEATIRPDGTITMPLVGDIKAAGVTPSTLRDTIKVQLSNYIKLAAGNEVTVAVKAWKSYRFTVQGEIGRPGVYTSDEWLTVSDVLALAGGPTRFADRNSIVLMRKNANGERVQIPLDFDQLASGKRPEMNCWVLAGDVIYVP